VGSVQAQVRVNQPGTVPRARKAGLLSQLKTCVLPTADALVVMQSAVVDGVAAPTHAPTVVRPVRLAEAAAAGSIRISGGTDVPEQQALRHQECAAAN
jgi:hypothetical protein